eukprot:RCo010901
MSQCHKQLLQTISTHQNERRKLTKNKTGEAGQVKSAPAFPCPKKLGLYTTDNSHQNVHSPNPFRELPPQFYKKAHRQEREKTQVSGAHHSSPFLYFGAKSSATVKKNQRQYRG